MELKEELNKRPGATQQEFGLLAVAWAQFLVMVTAVEKSDFHSWLPFLQQVWRTPDNIPWNFKVYGPAAVLLDVLALVALMMGSGILSAGSSARTMARAGRSRCPLISVGEILWALSFLCFLMYLDWLIAVTTYIATAGLLSWLGSGPRGSGSSSTDHPL